ncbi:hypothetical protein QBC44DRAFT_83433 [Cladorrhinum sp. PSN332]|nr:hypothetical protein QBC44DRAFT_83433 [Cladorrhinum sp. PSN332]
MSSSFWNLAEFQQNICQQHFLRIHHSANLFYRCKYFHYSTSIMAQNTGFRGGPRLECIKKAFARVLKDNDMDEATLDPEDRRRLLIQCTRGIAWKIMADKPLIPPEVKFVMPEKLHCCQCETKNKIPKKNFPALSRASQTTGAVFAPFTTSKTGSCNSCSHKFCYRCGILNSAGLTVALVDGRVLDKSRWQPVGWECGLCRKRYFVQNKATDSTVELDPSLQLIGEYRYINFNCTKLGCLYRTIHDRMRQSHFKYENACLNAYNNAMTTIDGEGALRQLRDARSELPGRLQWNWMQRMVVEQDALPWRMMMETAAWANPVWKETIDVHDLLRMFDDLPLAQWPLTEFVDLCGIAKEYMEVEQSGRFPPGFECLTVEENEVLKELVSAHNEVMDSGRRVAKWARDLLRRGIVKELLATLTTK